jgi:hypothetical protein
MLRVPRDKVDLGDIMAFKGGVVIVEVFARFTVGVSSAAPDVVASSVSPDTVASSGSPVKRGVVISLADTAFRICSQEFLDSDLLYLRNILFCNSYSIESLIK